MADSSFSDKVKIVKDKNGKEIVIIDEIRFKGKRAISWNEVRDYLRQFVGKAYTVDDTKDLIFIGNDLPNEYSGSEYTYALLWGCSQSKGKCITGNTRDDNIG